MSNQKIVITGSTRGIGYGLAEAFLQLGCAVAVSSRSQTSMSKAVRELSSKYGSECVFSHVCDVTDPMQIDSLWEAAASHFGRVDIWINNAGYAGEMGMVWERPATEVKSVIATNLIGTIYGAQAAMRGMMAQGYGAIYNLEGMGSDGRKHVGLSLYGTSKSAIHYFTEALALEAKDTGILIGSLSPGMVATDLLRDRYQDRPEDWERAKRIFNILAERVEVVAPWLAKQMLINRKNGVILSYSSTWKIMWKWISGRFIRRTVFD